MAMTKKEAAEMAALREELARAKAFRFTTPISRDLPPPALSRDGLSKGWDFNAYNGEVEKACSSSISHGYGWDKTTSQRPRSLFSTELRALQAMRYEMERDFSGRLAHVDMRIAELTTPEETP